MKSKDNKLEINLKIPASEVEILIRQYLEDLGFNVEGKNLEIMPQLKDYAEDRWTDRPVKFEHVNVKIK